MSEPESSEKKCSKCGVFKNLSEFSPSSDCIGGRRGTCKDCASKWAIAWQKRRKESLWGRMKFFVSSSKNRAKERGMRFDLDNDFLVKKYESQNGLCAVTGLPFRLWDDIALIRVSPYLPSLDRIDSKKGYTKDNVHFVLWAINMGKGDWQTDDVLPIWEKAILMSKKNPNQ